jgi:SAM-dependent methyltransferase
MDAALRPPSWRTIGNLPDGFHLTRFGDSSSTRTLQDQGGERRYDRIGGTVNTIVNYDEPGYDYRTYWDDRRYELWAEDHALRRITPRLGEGRWFIDFGGGFGRNAQHYRNHFDHYVVADYSATNLTNAGRLLADDIHSGGAFLVRCDLRTLPFHDAAFDAAMVVRVLHHMTDIQQALAEMGRVVRDRWLLDVPIKHHALALLRTVGRSGALRVFGPNPLPTGDTANRFWNFQLPATRQMLAGLGWRSSVVASVNNLRRWDQGVLPAPLTRALEPGARLVEAIAQRCGHAWWGPNQFVLAERTRPLHPIPTPTVGDGAPALAGRMICPSCRGTLRWGPKLARCRQCPGRYPLVNGYWDFTA